MKVVLICTLFFLGQNVYAQTDDLLSVYDRIYIDIDGTSACFRLTNATSSIGCSATPANVSGVIWYAENQESVNSVLTVQPPIFSSYIVLLEPYLFTRKNVLDIYNSGYAKGILVPYISENGSVAIPQEFLKIGYSPAMPCPNEGFRPSDNSCQDWNSVGNGLSFEDFEDFAIFALTSNESYYNITSCHNEHNIGLNNGTYSYPLCSAELKADMQSVISTQECFERSSVWTNLGVAYCDSLGDKNVWSTLFEVRGGQKVIMVATKLDSSSFFPYLSYGANNEMAGVVTLLAAAEALGEMKRNGELINTTHSIMFVFFQGESWDYIGSSRMAYDMIKGVFPYETDANKQQPPLLNLTDIMSFIELSQVGIQSDPETDTPTYYLHHNNSDSIVSLLNSTSQQNNVTFNMPTTSNGGYHIPPASAQMFMREVSSIPVVILADYNQRYNNRFFGSRYDVLENLIGQDRAEFSPAHPVVHQLTNLATTLSQALLNMSVPVTTSDEYLPKANPDVVYNLLDCFLSNTNCSFFRARLSYDIVESLPSKPLNRYVSVSRTENTVTKIVFQLMANFTGVVNSSETDCGSDYCTTPDNVQTYDITGITGNSSSSNDDDSKVCLCVKSYTHYHTAVSPAFELNQYTSTYYSTWAESQWTSTGVRIYLVTHVGFEVGLLFVGLLLSLAVFLVACQCNRVGRQVFAVSAEKIIVRRK